MFVSGMLVKYLEQIKLLRKRLLKLSDTLYFTVLEPRLSLYDCATHSAVAGRRGRLKLAVAQARALISSHLARAAAKASPNSDNASADSSGLRFEQLNYFI